MWLAITWSKDSAGNGRCWASQTQGANRRSGASFPHASDEALLALASEENRILITEDKDFGELVFLRGLPHPGIVRLVEMTPQERADAMRTLIERHADAMRDRAIIVVTEKRVRIRSAGTVAHDNDQGSLV